MQHYLGNVTIERTVSPDSCKFCRISSRLLGDNNQHLLLNFKRNRTENSILCFDNVISLIFLPIGCFSKIMYHISIC